MEEEQKKEVMNLWTLNKKVEKLEKGMTAIKKLLIENSVKISNLSVRR